MSTEISLRSVEFNTYALMDKARREEELVKFLDDKEKFQQGPRKDWDYTHNVWGTTPDKDESKWSAMLLDPGAAKIMSFMGVRPDHDNPVVVRDHVAGQIDVTMKTKLRTIIPILYINPRTGDPVEIYPAIAEGVGACTTQEKRFKVKWENYTGRGLIASGGYTVEDLESIVKNNPERIIRKEEDILKTIFFMPDPDAQGSLNTLVKMSAKRSEGDGVFQIPGVAQRFSQEIDVTDTTLSEKGERVPVTPAKEPEPAPKVDWNDKIAGEIEMKYRLTPKEMEALADDIIKKSDGLTTTRNHALSILKQRLEKAKPKEEPEEGTDEVAVIKDLKKNIQGAFSKSPTWVDSQIAARMKKGVSTKDAARDLLHSLQEDELKKRMQPHDIPDDLLQLATELSKATGKTLKEISDAMDEERDKAAGILTSEAALSWVANKLGAPIGTGAPEEAPIVEDENPLGEAIKQELRRLNLPIDLRVEFSAADEALLMYPTKFLGDRFSHLKDYLDEKYPGTEWIRDGSASHFKVPV